MAPFFHGYRFLTMKRWWKSDGYEKYETLITTNSGNWEFADTLPDGYEYNRLYLIPGPKEAFDISVIRSVTRGAHEDAASLELSLTVSTAWLWECISKQTARLARDGGDPTRLTTIAPVPQQYGALYLDLRDVVRSTDWEKTRVQTFFLKWSKDHPDFCAYWLQHHRKDLEDDCPLFAEAGKRPRQSTAAILQAVLKKISLWRNSDSIPDNDSRLVADWYRARQMSEDSGVDGSERAPKRKRARKGDQDRLSDTAFYYESSDYGIQWYHKNRQKHSSSDSRAVLTVPPNP